MRRYFISGGTGFIGREIVRQLLEREDTELVVCLTRGHRKERLEDDRLLYWKGDVTEINFPSADYGITDLIHGANEVNDLLQPDQLRYYYTIVEGTNRVLKWAATTGIQRSLILSSGAVARDTLYGRAKRQCEMIARSYGGNTKIARIFSVVGPEMPLNGQYAAGRFVGQALKGRVQYYGGSSVRTYLDVTDCANWLLKLLQFGPDLDAIDVAGWKSIRMQDLAELVGQVFAVPVQKIDGPDRVDVYIPDVPNYLHQTITLTQSLERIRDYHKALSYLRNSDLEPAT